MYVDNLQYAVDKVVEKEFLKNAAKQWGKNAQRQKGESDGNAGNDEKENRRVCARQPAAYGRILDGGIPFAVGQGEQGRRADSLLGKHGGVSAE